MSFREEYEALMEKMRTSEADAVAETNELFTSDDMTALLNKLTELKDKTIPGGHYDQILGGTIQVITGTRNMAKQAIEAANKAAEPQPVFEDPAVVETNPQS